MKQFVLLGCLICVLSCNRSNDKDILARVSTLPSFNMLLLDSTTLFNTSQIPKGKPVLVLYFRPDCPHCNQETEDLISHMDSLKDTRIYFLAGASLEDIRGFAKHYRLALYQNITIGKDHEHSFMKVFRPSTIPYVAIYNSEKKLVKIYEQQISVDKIFKALHS